MSMLTLRRPLLVLGGLLTLTLSGWAAAEPPSRAVRLGYISGTVSLSPAGESDWVQAEVNLPLTTGDRLWVDANSRAELQIGGAAIRLGPDTSVTLLNLDDRIAQVQLAQGTLKVRVRRMGADQSFEVDTPNLAFTLDSPGEFRLDADPNDDATAVVMQSGRAEVYGEGASYAVDTRQGYRFYGTGLSDYERLAPQRDDDFDQWARDRERRGDNSPSVRYVSPEVVGYEDLDANGTWRADPNYGNVWTPSRVAADWTPYRDGHWAWVAPWGWTWVDDAPWGYTVSHYGRWTNISGSWCWVPGPPREQAVYAPALVAFVGGQSFQAATSIGWFPLAPREVYQPSYPVSRSYFDRINRSNAVIAPAAITNVYNITNVTNNTTVINRTTDVSKIVYVNQHVTGAVVAVPTHVFVQSQPVAKAAVSVSKETAASAPVGPVAAVAPRQESVHGGAPSAGAKPPARERSVVARTAPPPPPVAFAAQQQQLAVKPGAPIDDRQRTQLKSVAPAVVAPKVTVVTAAQKPAATAVPPATAPASKTPEARKADAARTTTNRDAPKGDEAKSDALTGTTAKAETGKTEAARVDAAKADADRAEAEKAEVAKAAIAKAEAARVDAAKAESARAEDAKGEAAKAATAKAEAARADAVKAEAANAEAAKAAAAKAEAAKVDAAKAESARAEAAKAEGAKAATAKAEAERADAAKAEAGRLEAAKAEAAKAATAKAEAARVGATKAEAARAEAAKAEVAKITAAKAEAAKANAAKAEATRAAAARAASTVAPSAAHVPVSKQDVDSKAKDEKKKSDEETH